MVYSVDKYPDNLEDTVTQRTHFIGFTTQPDKNRKGYRLTDLELVKKDLMNHFQTRRGERVMMPTYGTLIWDYLFEPFTDGVRQLIEEDVRRVLSSDPRVKLIDLQVDTFDHGIILAAELKYTPWDVVETFSINFDRRSQEG